MTENPDTDLHGTDVGSLVPMNLTIEPTGEPEPDHPDNRDATLTEADLSGDSFDDESI